jgi:glucans biosynthesis protein C
MRKNYLDNLRNMMILLLFPVHTFMIWNNFGRKFYIWAGADKILSTLIVAVNPWFMPLLFAVAGISARYSLLKRSKKEFLVERVKKLLVPFITGLVFLVPVQTLYARKYFFEYKGNYIDNIVYFFTHITDMTGYDGCFTPGQLWFILFLFIISILFLVLNKFISYEKVEKYSSRLNVWQILAMFIPVALLYYVGNFGSFSIGKCFTLFILGYYVLSNDNVLEIIRRNVKLILVLFAVSEVTLIILFYRMSFYEDIFVNFTAWTGILAFVSVGEKFLDKSTFFTKYFNAASYPVYILHQSILVAAAYYTVININNLILRITIIMLGSFLVTIACYEIINRIPIIRNLFGIYKKKRAFATGYCGVSG